MIGTLDHSQNPSRDHQRVLDFLNQELQASVNFKIEEEYPTVFRPYPGGRSFYFTFEGRIVAHVGTLIKKYQGPDWELSLGLIGTVTTHSSFRKKGLATQLIQEALHFFNQEACALSILWSDQPEFYESLGFYRCGLEKDFRFSQQHVGAGNQANRLYDRDKDLEALWNLYSQQSYKMVRSLAEMKQLLNIPQTEVYVTQSGNALTSYVAINKGKDFTHYIHEWAGDKEAVQNNVIACQTGPYREHPLTLIAPFDTEEDWFGPLADHHWLGSLGLIKLLDKNLLLAAYQQHLKSKNNLTEQKEWQKLTDEECLIQVLGKDGWKSQSPLPLFLWGFDSI